MPEKKRLTQRKNNGQSLVELCAAVVIFIPIFLSAIDIGYLGFGAAVNDNVCADAARFAATGAPEYFVKRGPTLVSVSSPYLRVQQFIALRNRTLPFEIGFLPEVYQSMHMRPAPQTSGPVDGDLQVVTTALLKPPFLLKAVLPLGLTVKASHTVPITYCVNPQLAANDNNKAKSGNKEMGTGIDNWKSF